MIWAVIGFLAWGGVIAFLPDKLIWVYVEVSAVIAFVVFMLRLETLI